VNREHPNTKERLLDAAELLFAERGFDGVSVRELAAAAAVNVAAVNYHFQTKENLYREVLLRRLHFKREASLAVLRATPRDEAGRPDLEQLIRGFVRQYLEEILAAPHGANFMRLVAAEMHDPDHGGETIFSELVIPVAHAFQRALVEAVPELGEEEAAWIQASLTAQVIHVVMRWLKRHDLDGRHRHGAILENVFPALGASRDAYIRQAVEHVTRFSIGGIRALAQQAAAATPATADDQVGEDGRAPRRA
jgi:AcrR family transcriptional regulator